MGAPCVQTLRSKQDPLSQARVYPRAPGIPCPRTGWLPDTVIRRKENSKQINSIRNAAPLRIIRR